MSKKNIYLSLLRQYSISAMNFLKDDKLEKKITYNDDDIEVIISIEENNIAYIQETSQEITSLIVSIMEDYLLKQHILKYYNDDYIEEKRNIYLYSLNLFDLKQGIIRDAVYKRVYNHILHNDYLDIDGFVTFRIKDFTKYIPIVSDLAIEEYMMQRDQEEFINVLKYFIDMQEEKIDYLKVHIIESNYIALYDKKGNRIDNIDDEDIINMAIQENLNYEDFLISTLLTLCPKKIEILDSSNNEGSIEIIETIKSIFGDKVNIILQN